MSRENVVDLDARLAAALGLGIRPTRTALVERLVELGDLPTPAGELGRDLMVQIALCAQDQLLVNGPAVMDRAEATHYVISCATQPVDDSAWWDQCQADLHTDRLVDLLTPLVYDIIAPRLAEAGCFRLVDGRAAQ